jgi:D-alanyl-D-alanine carboxypeptidase/D-alanyl-D-alanine-endopeptidase (penicillin-binding protein 4)
VLPLALAALLAMLAAALPAVARAARGLRGVRAQLSHELTVAGRGSGAYVYDLTSNQVLFSERAGVMRPPASVEKLYTATAALRYMGPSARLTTTVLGSGRMGPEGIWEGNLYLHGGGDPTFGDSGFIRGHYGGHGASVGALVSQLTGTDGITSVTGRVEGDESYFDSLRGEPSSGYAPDHYLEGTLSALSFDRGAQGSERGAHAPAAYAALQLRRGLTGAGVHVHGSAGAASAPPHAQVLASVSSPTLAELLGLMLPPSDNFFAETLVKDLGARFGGRGTTAAGAAVVRRALAPMGLHPSIVDGSGLSRADLTSPQQVVTLLRELAPTPDGTLLRDSMAVAGHTGTLEERMRNTTAAGRCQAKTGTLIGVSNLAGYCRALDGHVLAFAFFDDGIEIAAAHTIQDNMAITLAGY